MSRLIASTSRGLYCAAGDFYIDPWGPVARAMVTHAHSDHARPGSGAYLTAKDGERLLRARLGDDAAIQTLRYGERLRIGDATVSLHPAGHLLGSAQVRIEHGGRVTVVSGDYKTDPDPTCAAFEPQTCDTFVTESTFALPIYRWPSRREITDAIHRWWREGRERKRTCVLLVYALGKAQRVLADLDPTTGPILLHGAVERLTEIYRAAGVRLPPARYASAELAKETRGRAMVLAPPSAAGSPWIRKFGPVSTGLASGWMSVRGIRRWRNVDRGFALSDHADWNGILHAVEATGADEIVTTHGYAETLARWLGENGKRAEAWPSRPVPDGEDEADVRG